MRLPWNASLKLHPLLLPIPSVTPQSNNFRRFTIAIRNSWFPSKSAATTKTLARLRFRCCGSIRAMEAAPPPVQVKETIDLTETEKQIFERLLGTLRHFNLQTQLRVAGGWVRDKLLGKDCYDIDIALDDMLGSEFVEKVKDYLLSKGEEVQGLAVIPCNPEQSKHLETARMRLLDIWIDFVNLRSEKYSENSRIPTMQFGSAEEDAYRRDLTINSLFYNINTSSVEDLTGRGTSDLKSGRIVTPLPPKETFLDDPLRVLRAIRFGARFGFVLDEKLKEAASCDDVKGALKAKVSKERIGTEIDLMISGNHPVKAMSYICDLDLFWVVFSLAKGFEPSLLESCDRTCLAYMVDAWNLMQSVGWSFFSEEKRRLALYAALFLPLRDTTYKDNKGKELPVVNDIFRSSLKGKASDADTVVSVHNASKKFLSLLPSLESNDDSKLNDADWVRGIEDVLVPTKVRVVTGFLLRDIKDFWRVSLLLSLLLYPTEVNCTRDVSETHSQLEKRRELFKAVENTIFQLGLEKIWQVKPLVNGKDIISVLQLKSGGPLVREWQQKLLAWQLAHPFGTAEECLDWMRQSYSKRLKTE